MNKKLFNIKKGVDFIPLERINFKMAKTQFKFKRGIKSLIGFGLVGFGVVTLPLPTASPLFIALGLMLSSPLSFKHSLRNAKDDLKFNINKRLVLWGVL